MWGKVYVDPGAIVLCTVFRNVQRSKSENNQKNPLSDLARATREIAQQCSCRCALERFSLVLFAFGPKMRHGATWFRSCTIHLHFDTWLKWRETENKCGKKSLLKGKTTLGFRSLIMSKLRHTLRHRENTQKQIPHPFLILSQNKSWQGFALGVDSDHRTDDPNLENERRYTMLTHLEEGSQVHRAVENAHPRLDS